MHKCHSGHCWEILPVKDCFISVIFSYWFSFMSNPVNGFQSCDSHDFRLVNGIII